MQKMKWGGGINLSASWVSYRGFTASNSSQTDCSGSPNTSGDVGSHPPWTVTVVTARKEDCCGCGQWDFLF